MSTAIKKTESKAVSQINPEVNLLELAIKQGADVNSLSKIMDLQERQMNKVAEQDYNRAITEFQSTLRPISKNKDSYVGSYATLDHIAKTIAPLLSANHLSYSFESELTEDKVTVICKIKHVNGHSDSATFTAPIDDKAKVNAMQKTASALSYARRYALMLALGITTTDEDDDGNGAGAGVELITENQIADMEALASEVNANIDNFCKYLKVDNLADLPASKYDLAIKALEAKRDVPQ